MACSLVGKHMAAIEKIVRYGTNYCLVVNKISHFRHIWSSIYRVLELESSVRVFLMQSSETLPRKGLADNFLASLENPIPSICHFQITYFIWFEFQTYSRRRLAHIQEVAVLAPRILYSSMK